jgi:hypothetical protein
MKNVEILSYEYDKLGRFYRVLTRASIEKAVIDALAFTKTKYKETPTIGEILSDRDKLSNKVDNDFELHIPIYNIYAMIRDKSLKKKIATYENILELYDYAHDCMLLNHSQTYGKGWAIEPRYKLDSMENREYSIEEILSSKANLKEMLNSDFISKFATYKFNRMNNNPYHEYNEDEFLDIEKKAIESNSSKKEVSKKR